MPRSTWADYGRALLSRGGGVWPRTAKSIPVSPEMKRLFDLPGAETTPAALVQAMLRAPVDLLWLGGIGTYVKSSAESHGDVGDRANDALRVDGRDLRCKVIGEGANLGLTQRGRIEYALAGGRVNTDAIDNSGGVDCSDHEVNIKIALGPVVAKGGLSREERDRLLGEMTDEVAALVLRDNYQQTQALSVEEAKGADALDAFARLMQSLERAELLDRAIEFLPGEEELARRAAAKRGLTRPEMAVLLAYGKIAVNRDLLQSELPEDPLLGEDLVRYFPTALAERFGDAIRAHRLRREIIATSVTNSMVNRVGPTFVNEMRERTGHGTTDVARAYAVTRDVFDLRRLWGGVEALDYAVDAAAQTEMHLEIQRLTERGTLWFLRTGPHPLDMKAATARFRDGVAALASGLDGLLAPFYHDAVQRRARHYVERGVPEALACEVAQLGPLSASLDVVAISGECGVEPTSVARVHFEVGARFGIDRLRLAARSIEAMTEWDKQAVNSIVEDLYGYHRRLTASVLGASGRKKRVPENAVDQWAEARAHAVKRAEALLERIAAAPKVDIPMLAVANRHIRAMLGE
jgi:glutamate dehydrogenase